MSSPQEEIIIKYLLNKLSDREKEEFEESFFIHDDLFEQLKVAEMRLIDRFARQQMVAEEEREFTISFINTPERAAEVAKAISFHSQLNNYKNDESKEINPFVGKKNNWRNTLRDFFNFKKPVFAASFGSLTVLALIAVVILVASRNTNENLVVEVTNVNTQNIENRKINTPPTNQSAENTPPVNESNQNIQNINQPKNPKDKSIKSFPENNGNSQGTVNAVIEPGEEILANPKPFEPDREITTVNLEPGIGQQINLNTMSEKISFRLRLESGGKDRDFSVTVKKRTGEIVETFKNIKPLKVEDKEAITIIVSTEKLASGSYSITAIGEQKMPVNYQFNIVRKD